MILGRQHRLIAMTIGRLVSLPLASFSSISFPYFPICPRMALNSASFRIVFNTIYPWRLLRFRLLSIGAQLQHPSFG
ncbi:hypothetical protein PILCRDRAFT_819350 [Piloderma croceum F 1598]|uniref:Uncharacterized protein n=1 Tax=Piloderma croceum (strain F 1598) TaxID=765440 RepID=A0A0C3C2E9_PILCF|nr:hypothetical protein PILCRDRAFT_819350 [Piloderma croceum F 1598]